jgi:hypothetical protein
MVAGGKGYSLKDAFGLISDVVAELGYARVNVLSVPWPTDIHPIDTRSFIGDIGPLAALCDWQPIIMLREGITRTAKAVRPAVD